MAGVAITLSAVAGIFFLFYRIIRVGANSDKQLREITKNALG